MAKPEYIYAVARIRSREGGLLNAAFLDSLLAAPDEAACLHLLAEHGWGEAGQTAEEIFRGEEKKTWALMAELTQDLSVFDVFRLEADYHNLKAAVKDSAAAQKHAGIWRSGGTVDPQLFARAVASRDYSALPAPMQEIAAHAADVFLQTRDGQMCDVLIDRAALEAIGSAGRASGEPLLALYGELTVAAADIKTAVRAQRTGRDEKFLALALADCETLDTRSLAAAAAAGFEEICAYLRTTRYADAVAQLRRSPAAFERWCDNLLIRAIRPQTRVYEGLGPLAAYLLARQSEIRTARIILSGKSCGLPADEIRERVRETYV